MKCKLCGLNAKYYKYCVHCGTRNTINIKRALISIFIILLLIPTTVGLIYFSRIKPKGIELYNPPFNKDVQYYELYEILQDPNTLKEGLYENVRLNGSSGRVGLGIMEYTGKTDVLINITIQYNSQLYDIRIEPSSTKPIKYVFYNSSYPYCSILYQGASNGGIVLTNLRNEDAYFDVYYEVFHEPFINTTIDPSNAFNLDYIWNKSEKLEIRNFGYDYDYYTQKQDHYLTVSSKGGYVYFSFSVNQTYSILRIYISDSNFIGNVVVYDETFHHLSSNWNSIKRTEEFYPISNGRYFISFETDTNSLIQLSNGFYFELVP